MHGSRLAAIRVVLATLLATITVSACGGEAASSATSTTSARTPTAAASSVETASDASGAAELRPRGPVDRGARVIRVVDGDTIHVDIDGDDVTVRMIGIDTPETVQPESPVECFGPEASAYAKRLLTGATVTIEYDGSQGRTDRFGRTLAYVWIERPGADALFNRLAVLNGFARQYRYDRRYAWERELVAAQRKAKAARAGLWGACPAR